MTAGQAQEPLAPCPFCGNEARIQEIDGYRPTSPKTYEPTCTFDCGVYVGDFETKELAAAWWNRRAPLPDDERATLTARVAELEAQSAIWDVSVHNLKTRVAELEQDSVYLHKVAEPTITILQRRQKEDMQRIAELEDRLHEAHINR